MFILYLFVMVSMFCVAFLYHYKVHSKDSLYERLESTIFSLIISVPWIVTIWFFIPYLFIFWWIHCYSNK